MCKIFISILFISTCNSLFSQRIGISDFQTNSDNKFKIAQDTLKNELVFTPFGPALRTDIHYVDDNHHLGMMNGNIEIIQTKTGVIENKFNGKSIGSGSKYPLESENYNILSELYSQQGWITHAVCQIYNPYPKPTYFSTEWVVPSPPSRSNNQLIYLFIGLVGGDSIIDGNSTLYLLQPVLQWGESPSGGGEYWAICNWFVTNKSQFFYDTLIKVNPGDNIQGVIKLITDSKNSFTYNSSFIGYGHGLDVSKLPRLETPCFALEAYNIKRCDEYPVDEKMRMYNIQIITDTVYPPVIWYTSNTIDNCGQFTNIINESPDNGEVNIHFRKPHSPDGSEDIFIYPNPVLNNVHFSITDPLLNCRIEIYNSPGNLIHTEMHKTLEYGYDLNFQNYAPGLYIIKFYYQKDLITREASHIFKIIKI